MIQLRQAKTLIGDRVLWVLLIDTLGRAVGAYADDNALRRYHQGIDYGWRMNIGPTDPETFGDLVELKKM